MERLKLPRRGEGAGEFFVFVLGGGAFNKRFTRNFYSGTYMT